MRRLSRIDEIYRLGYHYLREEDECYFLGEYTPRAGYSFGETNDLISNLKKEMDRQGRPEWHYKERAIQTAGAWLTEALAEDRAWAAATTLVPIPPSHVRSDPLHDDRLLQILSKLQSGIKLALDVRQLVYQSETTRSSSRSEQRLRPSELRAVYRIDEDVAEPTPRQIALFDDLLTSGAHFRAAKEVLSERFPGVSILGIFLARSTH